MQAVILAAGLNTRFKEAFDEPFIKQALHINGIPILINSLNSLERIGCSEVILVSGQNTELLADLLEKYYKGDLPIIFLKNLHPEKGNGYSLGISQKKISNYFYLLMSDHIYEEAFFDQANSLRSSHVCSLFVDYKIDRIYDLDDATKVLEKDGYIMDIGKNIESYNCIDTGFFYLHERIFETFNRLTRSASVISLSDIIRSYIAQNDFTVTDIGDSLWQDVDNMEMYNHARKIFQKK